MQRFSVDIQRPGAPLVVHAKQGDTARAVQVSLYDGGVPYVPPEGTQPIVFYKTAGGMGNYSERVTLSGNTLDIPLIAQMLTSPGGGLMCVALVSKSKAQLATWNMEVHVECVPGMDSKPAKDWYTAMAEYVAQTLANVDQAKAEVAKAKAEVQRAKEEADRAASLTSRYDKDLAGSTVATACLVNCNLLEGTPLHVVSHIEPVQEGSGDPSPDNVRPIKGFTGAKLTRCGKNLLEITTPTKTVNGVTFTVNSDKSITVNGTPTSGSSAYNIIAKIPTSGKTVVLSANNKNQQYGKFWVEAVSIRPDGTTRDVPLTKDVVLNNTSTSIIGITIAVAAGVTVQNQEIKLQVEVGDTVTPYEPYQGNEYTVQFGEAVYGGSYDWDKGELISALLPLNIDYLWRGTSVNEDYARFVITGKGQRGQTGYCDILPLIKNESAYSGSKQGVYPNGDADMAIDFLLSVDNLVPFGAMREDKGTYRDAAKKYLAAKKAKLYGLMTPQKTLLTPQQIPALSGTNNLHSDTGDTTVSRLRAVPLSDATDSSYDASAGVAATPAAVKAAYDLAGTAKKDAATAQGAAETAQSAADDAQGAAEVAQGAADDASRAAGNAQSTANAAADAASAAGTAARNAQGAADNALNKANAAMPKSGGEYSGLVGNENGINVQGRWFRNTTVVNSGWVNVDSQWITLVRK